MVLFRIRNSRRLRVKGSDISLSYLPEFVAKNPFPHSSLVMSLVEFMGDLPEEGFLCPVRVVGMYLGTAASLAPRPRSLLISPRCPLRSL